MGMLLSSALLPLAAAVSLALAAMSCSDNGTGPSPSVDYGESFRLAVGDAQVVGGEGLSLRFEGVSNDSRCPADVQCIWEGEAFVRLRVQAPALEARTLEVRVRGAGGAGDVDDRFAVDVTRLEPAPLSTKPIPAGGYTITLAVTKR